MENRNSYLEKRFGYKYLVERKNKNVDANSYVPKDFSELI